MKSRLTKRATKGIRIVLSCFMLVFLISTTAFANTSSAPYTASVYGYNYSFTSEVWVRSTTVEGVAALTANTNVPTGYMGGQARLFNSSGNIAGSSTMTYNDSSISGFFVYSSRTSNSGQYFSQSVATFYNGNGYTPYVGYQSPYQMFPVSLLNSEKAAITTETSEEIKTIMAKTKYNVNSKGETYGSALSAYSVGVEPDLISAVGTNGVNGYVRATDLAPKFTSVKEAVKHNGKNGDICTIPLYDADGATKLGEFELVTNYEVVK